MKTFQVTITAVFEADSAEEALADFEEWLMQRNTIHDGAVVQEQAS